MTESSERFTGDLIGALRAIRPIVEGVAKLHQTGYVHRDIKPDNIFVGADHQLILGDFGLIHFEDQAHSRLSGTWENFGSRDWMPAWAMGKRIDQIRPTFDVFALGKVIWVMVSDSPILQLWYWQDERFNLEDRFPNSPKIRLAREIFKKTIVEREADCHSNASYLLKEIDSVLGVVDAGGDILAPDIRRNCRVCGRGNLEMAIDEDLNKIRNFG